MSKSRNNREICAKTGRRTMRKAVDDAVVAAVVVDVLVVAVRVRGGRDPLTRHCSPRLRQVIGRANRSHSNLSADEYDYSQYQTLI